jgi:DNA-binding SARP family transcriptional activator
MRAHDHSGEPARALLAYARLRTDLSVELGVDPAPATRDLHAKILQTNA